MVKNITRKNIKIGKKYVAKDFTHLLGKVKGIDDKLMKIHFTLYNGLVSATNEALTEIQNTVKTGVKNMVQYSAIQKELSFFFNGMRLHEMYFGVMCGEHMDKRSDSLNKAIDDSFGSFIKWKNNFIETGTIPGVGFVALCRDRETNRLFNVWISEFNIGELISTDILLVMDMWEHAYIAEFELDIKKYANAFLDNVNWSVVSKNFN
jgi:Fe-Mn family superoxide dismutase